MANTSSKKDDIGNTTNTIQNTNQNSKGTNMKKQSNDITTETTNNEVVGNARKSKELAQIDPNNILEITDNFFIEKTNDIYINIGDYLGKTIKIEGLIYAYEDTNGDILHAVVRNTPGCCGNDGLAGLDIRYNGEYPPENTWVEVVGVMGTDTVYNNPIPAIQVGTMTEKEPGNTFLSN